jgi:aspartyl-tRNA(Asn)/glutamyl-tRNA(Gln) amidotransferase subunit C
MAVTLDDVRHVASLARLGLSDERAASLVAELNTILGHMEVLSGVDTSNIGSSGPVASEGLPLKPDHGPSVTLVRPPEDFAPSMRDGFFLVPRLATHETGEEN